MKQTKRRLLAASVAAMMLVSQFGVISYAESDPGAIVADVTTASVSTLEELQKALADSNVTEITITAPITITSDTTLTAANPVTIITKGVTDVLTVTSNVLTVGKNVNISSDTSVLYATGTGTINVDGATINSTCTWYDLCYADTNGKINVTSGTLTNGTNIIGSTGNAEVTVSGGTLTSTGSNGVIYARSNATVTIEKSAVLNCENGIGLFINPNDGAPVVSVKGGTITAKTALQAYSGDVEISGGTLTGTTAAVAGNTANIEITGGTFSDDVSEYLPDGEEMAEDENGNYVIAVHAESITITPAVLELTEGDTETLTASVTPVDTTDKAEWTTSDATVATVADGVVTAVKEGIATITVKAGDVTATCEVTVKAAAVAVTGVTLDVTTLALETGKTGTLTATVAPETATDKTVTWTTSDASVATVADGVVTAVKAGTATITVKTNDGGMTASCTVTVSDAVVAVTGVTLDVTTLALETGKTGTLTATVAPETATDKTVTWTTSDASVATVADGVVTAVKAGTATITVKTNDGGMTASCTVTVTDPIPEATVYDKVEANFTADTIVMQTANEGDGEKSLRFVKMVSEESIANKSKVTFSLYNKVDGVGFGQTFLTSDKYYTTLKASDKDVVAKEGYVFLAITINNVPANVEIDCDSITLS